MAERLLILVALGAVLCIAWLLLRTWQSWRLQRLGAERLFNGVVPAGRPAVVAFTLPSCGECRARQAPALERLRTKVGATATITTLSVEAHPSLVERLGILTVPATVVLDAAGAARFLNQGFADETRLHTQLAQL